MGGKSCWRQKGNKGEREVVVIAFYPLSEEKKTKVLLLTPDSAIAANISPTPQSSSLRASPNLSRVLVLVNF